MASQTYVPVDTSIDHTQPSIITTAEMDNVREELSKGLIEQIREYMPKEFHFATIKARTKDNSVGLLYGYGDHYQHVRIINGVRLHNGTEHSLLPKKYHLSIYCTCSEERH